MSTIMFSGPLASDSLSMRAFAKEQRLKHVMKMYKLQVMVNQLNQDKYKQVLEEKAELKRQVEQVQLENQQLRSKYQEQEGGDKQLSLYEQKAKAEALEAELKAAKAALSIERMENNVAKAELAVSKTASALVQWQGGRKVVVCKGERTSKDVGNADQGERLQCALKTIINLDQALQETQGFLLQEQAARCKAEATVQELQAKLLVMGLQLASAKAERTFYINGWGLAQEEAAAEAKAGSVCSNTSQDCQESLPASPSTWSLTSSLDSCPAQDSSSACSTPVASPRSSLSGSKAPEGPGLVVKAGAGAVSRIPAAPGVVKASAGGATCVAAAAACGALVKAATETQVPKSAHKAAGPAGVTGSSTQQQAAGSKLSAATPTKTACRLSPTAAAAAGAKAFVKQLVVPTAAKAKQGATAKTGSTLACVPGAAAAGRGVGCPATATSKPASASKGGGSTSSRASSGSRAMAERPGWH